MNRIALALLLTAIVGAPPAIAQRHREDPADPTARIASTKAATQPDAKPGDRVTITQHVLSVNGRELKYQATAGILLQKDESDKPKAEMFYVAYELKPDSTTRATTARASTRPVTFVFNGGPGAASVWLHLGTVGPKRVELNDAGVPIGPPYRLVDNESTWLGASDLVFIDPVGTGYSRPAQGEKGDQFYGVEEDVRSISNFIRLWVTRNDRWLSPKFLAGESYGTTRAAGLSTYLLNNDGISLNGIILISSVLNFQTISPGESNDLPYPLFLTSYTAAAWYHKKLAPELQADLDSTLREAEKWALGDYTTALAAGSDLSDAQRDAVAQQLARYTGLSVDWVKKADLRIRPGRFRKQLLADQRKIIGRFDARITGTDIDPLTSDASSDPSLSFYLGAYSADFNHYVRTELKFESDLPYEVLSDRVDPWNFGPAGNGYLYVADKLRNTVLQNPQLKVLVASGRMDLATPYRATDYTISHMRLTDELRKNIVSKYYRSGHMIYHDAASRAQLREDVEDFMRAAITPP